MVQNAAPDSFFICILKFEDSQRWPGVSITSSSSVRLKSENWPEICETFNQSEADDDKLLVQGAVLHSGSV